MNGLTRQLPSHKHVPGSSNHSTAAASPSARDDDADYVGMKSVWYLRKSTINSVTDPSKKKPRTRASLRSVNRGCMRGGTSTSGKTQVKFS